MNFWNKEVEMQFFQEFIGKKVSPLDLFYKIDNEYFAYAPKGTSTKGKALQSRNSLIGQYTEKWCKSFLKPIAEELGLYAVNNVVCKELGLTNASDADVAFCTSNDKNQSAQNIKLIFEVKMSITNNYQYNLQKGTVQFIGDYKTHKGTPSILRSDSMLKAIGKAINIRVSGMDSRKIPIIILGSSPITESYKDKVDSLKQAGVIQSFISLYPNPIPSNYIKMSNEKGFQTFSDYSKLKGFIFQLLSSDMNFFSSMLPQKILGEIITVSAEETDELARAEKFINLLNQSTP